MKLELHYSNQVESIINDLFLDIVYMLSGLAYNLKTVGHYCLWAIK